MQHKIYTLASRYIPLLLIIAIFPFFFTPNSPPESSRLFGSALDLGHILFFCLLVLYVNRHINLRRPLAVISLTIIVLIVGGLIELIQLQIGRDGNWLDVYYDLVGTWIGLVWCHPVTRAVRYARIVIFALTLPALLKILLLALLQFQAAQNFPLIADFETRLELYQYHGTLERSDLVHTHGNYSLQLTLQASEYSGINIGRSYPDWTPYNYLKMDIYIPDDQPLDIVIRVNDISHDLAGWKDDDRYNYRTRLYPGWNNLTLSIDDIRNGPATRLMDLQKISSIGIFTARLPAARVINIDNIKLEN